MSVSINSDCNSISSITYNLNGLPDKFINSNIYDEVLYEMFITFLKALNRMKD